MCLDNAGYELALERRRVYVALADADARRVGHIRVIDETGEDYVFPTTCFAPAIFPDSIRRILMKPD